MISRTFVNVRFLLYGAASYRSEQAIILIVLLNLRTTDGSTVKQTKNIINLKLFHFDIVLPLIL